MDVIQIFRFSRIWEKLFKILKTTAYGEDLCVLFLNAYVCSFLRLSYCETVNVHLSLILKFLRGEQKYEIKDLPRHVASGWANL